MNEERLEAYLHLIQTLLNRRSGEELAETLAANEELIDASLVRVMERKATDLSEQGENDDAAWLQSMAEKLAMMVGRNSGVSNEEYLAVLQEIIQVEKESNFNTQVVYPILQRHQDKLDENFARILEAWAKNVFSQTNSEQVQELAALFVEFSDQIQQFPLGSRANNLEIAITGYSLALEVYTKDNLFEQWAGIQNNLGEAYTERIRGEKAENLEMAISAYEAALEIRTQEAFPLDWARTQNNLGNAYSKRIRGEKAENLEMAIAVSQKALEVLTKETFPLDWARTQNNLGNAYSKRIRGKKAENLEMAIAVSQKALEVLTKETFPLDWARTQNNLGNAYSERIRGKKAENLEIAINAYRAALEVRTKETFLVDWVGTQNNLAITYSERIRGKKAENLEQSIAAYGEVLEVLNKEDFPYEWGITQNNLGIAYLHRIRGKKAENLEQAITAYEAALEVRTKDAFPYEWASTQTNLGLAYSERIQGEKAENLEMAIAASEKALEVLTKETFPVEWASTQNNLGNAYLHHIRGKKAENLKQAISAYEAALEVRTKEAFPLDWARTQNNLAAAYSERIRGEKAENLEMAISSYEAASKVLTKEDFPYEWGITQNNLGIASRNRIRGEKAENPEQAIIASEKALEVHTKEAFPVDWARTQNNLAAAYLCRIRGEKAQNLEQSIAASEKALEVYTKETFPYEWGITQNNLGNAYLHRIRGEKAQNLKQAIAASEKALEVHTKEAFPYEWGIIQNNLGNAYSKCIREKAENLELALAAYRAALEVHTKEAFPVDWARTQNNLAAVYLHRIRGEKAENLELALAASKKALKVYTKEAFPVDWAKTQNNLAAAYLHRIRGEKAENLELAIAFFQKALEVYTKEAFAQNRAETLSNLGLTYQKAKQVTLAYNTFKSAIDTVESLREEIVSGEETKRKQAEEWNALYRQMVKVCLKLDKIMEAIEYVERSKTRNLVEQILNRDLKTIFPPEVATQLEKYRDEIAERQYQIQHGKAENLTALAQHLQQLRQQRNELQNRYLPIGYGFKFNSFQTTLDDRTAIIEWYILNDKILTFIVQPKGELAVWQSQPEDQEALIDWINQYLQNYYNQKDQWRNILGEELKKLASILHIDEILTQIPNHCDKLILIPHRFLHLLPLHGLPVSQNSENSYCLLDLFAGGVNYAPSCQILQQVQQRKHPDFQSLFAVQNPTGDLQFTDLEVESILNLFPSPPPQLLSYNQATKDALLQRIQELKDVNYLHFSCHGQFNLNSPQDSCLLLAESVDQNNKLDLSKCLTLGNLFERGFDLNKCRLVILSACETGLIDVDNSSDEYIGLPSGFLYAGSSSVVSSLWTVDDMSTAYLMIKFLQILKAAFDGGREVSVAVALNQAQHWLRNITWEDLEKWANDLPLDSGKNREIREIVAKSNLDKKIGKKPFQSPYYWAGFTAIGK